MNTKLGFKLKRIQVDGNNFLYDYESNCLFRCTEYELKYLGYIGEQCYLPKDPGYSGELYAKILEYSESHLLTPASAHNNFHIPECFRDIEHYYIHKSSPKHRLSINITEQCNMRCRYCVYDPRAHHNYRNHRNVDINIDRALSIIDNLLENKTIKELIFSFFGGEPLLRPNTIVYFTDYIRKTNAEKKILFCITTNGTLLSHEVWDYLVENNFRTSISLDGARDTHNKNRQFRNGRPTYDIIMENLNYVKLKHPDYYVDNVHFIATLEHTQDLYRTIKEFDSKGMYKASTSPFVIDCAKEQMDYNEHIYIDQYLIDGLVSSYLEPHYGRAWLYGSTFIMFCIRFDRRTIIAWPENEKTLARGFCLPYYDQSFLSAAGKLLFCHHIENISFCTIKNGRYEIHFNELSNMVDALILFGEQNCAGCWVRRLCSLCWASMRDNKGILSIATMKRHCEMERKKVLAFLQIYIYLKLIDPNIFKNIVDHFPPKNEIK
jgi:uncharacterized protein